MSDTWEDIQAVKSKHSSLKEKLARRRKEREGIVAAISGTAIASKSATETRSSSSADIPKNFDIRKSSSSPAVGFTPSPAAPPKQPKQEEKVDPEHVKKIEDQMLLILSDVTLNIPINTTELIALLSEKILEKDIPITKTVVEDLLHKFEAQQLISIKITTEDGKTEANVISTDHKKLCAVTNDEGTTDSDSPSKKRKRDGSESAAEEEPKAKQVKTEAEETSLESLLSSKSAKEKESKKMSDEILQLLSAPTAKEQSIVEKFKSQGGAQVKEFCQYGTRDECMKVSEKEKPCDKLHFKKIIHKHTDESLGDCSFLNTCFHMDTCKYVHYEVDYLDGKPKTVKSDTSLAKKNTGESTTLFPPQWVQCDLRKFDMTVLGKFAVVMADPPWDIHMELPYGTMADDEMRRLPVPEMQDDGYIFLWVTGRAMELGRECLKLWGYERIDELIWVKTNQLQRIIRTGRTGHWFNHGKEHCLVGVKGNPKNMNKGLDCDVITAEVRATSHKPDEVYGIIERLAPGSRKIELFGRPHNVQPNWVTLGNQLDGVRLLEPDVVKAFKAKYPNGYSMS